MSTFCSQDDVDGYVETLRAGECIEEKCLKRLCSAVSDILIEENNVAPVLSPVTVGPSQFLHHPYIII